MSILDALGDRDKVVGRTYGVAAGIVTNNKDPDKLGRLKITFPWLSDDNETDWVRMTSIHGRGRARGFFPSRSWR